MDKIITYVIIGVAGVAALSFLIYKIVKFCKMNPEEKKQVLITYLKGLVAFAESQIVEHGKGAEKLQLVENTFKKKAPFIYKILLKVVGVNNLRDLIEVALKEIKRDFEK